MLIVLCKNVSDTLTNRLPLQERRGSEEAEVTAYPPALKWVSAEAGVCKHFSLQAFLQSEISLAEPAWMRV